MRDEKELIKKARAIIEHHNSKAINEKPPCIMCGKSSEATIYDHNTEIRVCANCAVTISIGLMDYGSRIIIPLPGENRIVVADPKTETEKCR